MALLSVTATDWTYRVDLSQGVGQFEANYVDVENFAPIENIFSGATLPDRLDIYVLSQGSYQLLSDFVIDEYRIREGPDAVTGTLSGRDSKALLLERFPVFTGAASTDHILRSENGSTTYRGMSVASNGSITYQATAVEALTDLVQRAGFTPSINVDDYSLGQDFVQGTETSFGEAIRQLLEPVRVTEKYRADVILAGDTLWIWQRDKGAPFGTVNIPYEDFTDRAIERQRPTLASSVQIQGSPFTYFEPEPVTITTAIAGWAFTSDYSKSYGPVTIKDPNCGIDLYTKEWTVNYDFKGRATTFIYRVQYHNYPIYDQNGIVQHIEPHIRRETRTETFEYEDLNTLDQGALPRLKKKNMEKFVEDFTHVKTWDKKSNKLKAEHQNYVSQVTQRVESTWTWPSAVGTSDEEREHARRIGALAEETINYECDTKDLIIPIGKTSPNLAFAPLYTKNKTGYHYIQSGNQLIRIVVDEGTDPAESGPQVIKETVFDEIGPGELPTAPQGIANPINQRSVTDRIECGPDTANEKIVLPRVGKTSDACRIRDQVIDQRKRWSLLGNFTMMPNLNVREGQQMNITGAPPRWQTTSFYIAGRAFERTADGLIMRLTGLAWL